MPLNCTPALIFFPEPTNKAQFCTMKTLLISNYPPSEGRSSAILLKKMTACLGENWALLTIMHPFNYSLKPTVPAGVPYLSLALPSESSYRPFPSVLGSVAAWLWEYHVEYFVIPKMVERICAFARAHAVDRIWCVLEGQTSIRLAVRVADSLGLPLYTQIFDSIDWYLVVNKIDRFTQKRILKDFDRAIKRSMCVASASPAMSQRIAAKHGVKAEDFVGTVSSSDIIRRTASPLCFSDPCALITIGYAGQLYCREEWDVLLQSLSEREWKIGEHPVKIVFQGYDYGYFAGKNANVQLIPFGTQGESIGMLSTCDVLYLPYFFDVTLKDISQNSFPSKLSSYYASGTPMIFHGPEYSSPISFARQFEESFFGCFTMLPNDFYPLFNQIFSDEKRYMQVSHNATEVVEKHLVDSIINQKIKNFLE